MCTKKKKKKKKQHCPPFCPSSLFFCVCELVGEQTDPIRFRVTNTRPYCVWEKSRNSNENEECAIRRSSIRTQKEARRVRTARKPMACRSPAHGIRMHGLNEGAGGSKEPKKLPRQLHRILHHHHYHHHRRPYTSS